MSLADRVAHSLPGASFELETLVKLVGIVETDAVSSAAVTCGDRTRLLVNPKFVEKYCIRDEHLFLLVMHEMWHVLLGHTTLYGRPTTEHNIAFDALINAGLARQHPQAAYRGFFEEINAVDIFPQLLLRPPRNWPHAPEYHAPGPRGTPQILRRLYPPAGEQTLEPTYEELIDLLRKHRGNLDANLLGDHSDDESLPDPLADPVFFDAVRRVVENWPPPPVPMRGRDAGGRARSVWLERRPSAVSARSAFAKVITEVLRPDAAGAARSRIEPTPVVIGPSPLPNPRDRLQHARALLGVPTILYRQEAVLPVITPDLPQRALVYLDVSGSMSHLLPRLVDLLVAPARRGLVTLRQFSTQVEPLTADQLLAGEVCSTYGTGIDCVLEDILTRPERRVLILTDGYVGPPNAAHLAEIQRRQVRLVAALPKGGWRRDMEGYAAIHELPGIKDGGEERQ